MRLAVAALQRNLQSRPRARPDPPSYELMQAYVNNTASEIDREIIESYAELHPEFARELRELQDFATMLKETEATEKERVEETASAGNLVLNPAATTPVVKASFWANLGRMLGLTGGWRVAAATAAVLVMVSVAAFVAWQLNRIYTSPNIAKIDNTPPTPPLPTIPTTPESGNTNTAPTPPETLPKPEPPTNPVIAFSVFLGARGSGTSKALEIGQGTQAVRLVAELPEPEAAGKQFQATLVTPRNEFQSLGAVKAAKSGIVVNVPARKLTASGAYSLRLKAIPASEDDVEYKYPFTVKKQ
jgi:anti-sigma-K factor RskA